MTIRNSQLANIEDFHTRFDQSYHGPIRFLPKDLMEFRLKFLREEINELEKAHAEGNMADAVDALVDLDYVLKGTIYLMGYQHRYDASWHRVHFANMKKILAGSVEESMAATGRGHATDVIKPPDWTPPSHDDLADPYQYHAHLDPVREEWMVTLGGPEMKTLSSTDQSGV